MLYIINGNSLKHTVRFWSLASLLEAVGFDAFLYIMVISWNNLYLFFRGIPAEVWEGMLEKKNNWHGKKVPLIY